MTQLTGLVAGAHEAGAFWHAVRPPATLTCLDPNSRKKRTLRELPPPGLRRRAGA